MLGRANRRGHRTQDVRGVDSLVKVLDRENLFPRDEKPESRGEQEQAADGHPFPPRKGRIGGRRIMCHGGEVHGRTGTNNVIKARCLSSPRPW